MKEELSKRCQVPVEIIPNGFDPELHTAPTCSGDVANVNDRTFRLVYTGSLTTGRDANPVVRAIAELMTEGTVANGGMELHLYGPDLAAISLENRRHVGRIVHLHGQVPFDECVRAQLDATALLVVNMPHYEGILTGKVFEYLATGRPILGFPTDRTGSDEVLQRTGTGASASSVAELKRLLSNWYAQWKTQGEIKQTRNEECISQYNRAKQAERLAEILEGAMRISAMPSRAGAAKKGEIARAA